MDTTIKITAFVLLRLFHSSAASFQWVDITEHHDKGRGLREHRDSEDALIRRIPSDTVFVFNLTSSVDEQPVTSLRFIDLPLCTGGVDTFELEDSGVLPLPLQQQLPSLRSYIGVSTKGYSADIVLSTAGVRAQVWMGGLRCFVDPHTKGRSDLHTAYSDRDILPGHPRARRGRSKKLDNPSAIDAEDRDRRLDDEDRDRRLDDASLFVKNYLPPAGQAETFIYTILVACSYEYIKFASDYGGAMALLTTTMTRVSGIWGREMGIRFTLHANNSKVCSEDPTTKIPVIASGELPNNDPMAWLSGGGWPGMAVSQNNIAWLTEKGIDNKTYDIAHYLSVGDAGGLGGTTVCHPIYKGRGGTAGTRPAGDSFDVDYVAHEMGHQFGTSHTWSGAAGACTEDQFLSDSAVELGSGSTLETYAGICDVDDIAQHSSPYFHIYSLAEFEYWFTRGFGGYTGRTSGCGVYQLSTTNRRPTVTAPITCSIPKSTPFILTGNGTDEDGDALMYVWEQLDSSPQRWSISSENKEGPLFVSLSPTANGNIRSFPKLSTVMDNAGKNSIDPLERLSTVNRSLHMALTARDKYNPSAGSPGAFGTFHTAFTTVNVAEYGPLAITAPTAGTALTSGSVLVSWEVAGPTGTPTTQLDNMLVMYAFYEVAYSTCTGSSGIPSQAGCGQSWNVVASNQIISSQGRGSVYATLPSSGQGKVIFRVKGSAMDRCEFYTVTPMLIVNWIPVPTPVLTATQPRQNSTNISFLLSVISLSFNGPIFLSNSGGLLTITPQNESLLSFNASQVQLAGSTLTVRLPKLNISTQYTVSIIPAMICATSTWPCNQSVSFFDWSFTTASENSTTLSDARPLNPSSVVRFDRPLFNLSFTSGIFIVSGNITVLDAKGLTYCLIDITDTTQVKLNISSDVLSIDFTKCALWAASTYNVSILNGTLGSIFGSPVCTLNFSVTTTVDPAPPLIESVLPPNLTKALPEYSEIKLIFNKYIALAPNTTAVITFQSLTAGSPNIVFPASDCCSNDNHVTIYHDNGEMYFAPGFQPRTTYSLVIPSNAFVDFNGNAFPGLSLGQYLFTTGCTVAPVLASVNFKVFGQSVVASLCYSGAQSLSPGRSNFMLVVPSNNATVASVGANSSNVNISGSCVSVSFPSVTIPSGVDSLTVALRYPGGVVADDFGNGILKLSGSQYLVTVKSSFSSATITGSLTLFVSSVSNFLKDSSTRGLVAQGIANNFGIPSSWVNVTLSGGRRLRDDERRLAGSVRVQYSITVPTNAPSSQNLQAVQAKVKGLTDSTVSLAASLTSATGTPILVTKVGQASTTSGDGTTALLVSSSQRTPSHLWLLVTVLSLTLVSSNANGV